MPEIALVADANGRLAHVSVDGGDVTDEVHTPRVDDAVSAVSRVPELRAALLERQRALAAEPGGIIMAGRDIGTVVLPDADLKIFLDASVEERARRRTEEREHRRRQPGGALDPRPAPATRRPGLAVAPSLRFAPPTTPSTSSPTATGSRTPSAPSSGEIRGAEAARAVAAGAGEPAR